MAFPTVSLTTRAGSLATRAASLTTRAPAKVNLKLHILGRRADGYHELESLVAFAGVGDSLALTPSEHLSLTVVGPSAEQAGPVEDNLVLKAVRRLLALRPALRVGAFDLTKRLPAEAGLGGGSSDAAAALRLMARLNGLAPDDPDIMAAARETGADVPVCLNPRARVMRGIGEDLGAPIRLRLFAVLVNPRVSASTPAVFKALGYAPGQPYPSPHTQTGPDMQQIIAGRNDLEQPAIRLAPAIADALALLAALPACRLARMSGSGATVFGLFDDCHAAARAARTIIAAQPTWWVKPTILR